MTQQDARQKVENLVRNGEMRIADVVARLTDSGCTDEEARSAVRASLERGTIELGEEFQLVTRAAARAR
jgi:hypothetical protein